MELRNGMWVETDQGVGLFHVDELATADKPGTEKVPRVHMVDSDGLTTVIVNATDVTGLRQARAASIPAARVGHLDAETLARLGYA